MTVSNKNFYFAMLFVFCGLCVGLFFGCTSQKMMTYGTFQQVGIGENIFDIQGRAGRPYQIKDLGNAKQEYIYIERLPITGSTDIFREYVLIVIDGKIIDKRIRESKTNPVHFDVY